MAIEQFGLFPDGTVYDNPLLAVERHGKEWVADGMSGEEIIAAAEQLGGEPFGRNGPKNLAGYVLEIITHQSKAADQGES
jgi:hypothetical protein